MLHRTLTRDPTAPTVLSGMGGIGKTQLALEYTYQHHTEFDLVWWLRAEEPTTLLADYAALAGGCRRLGNGSLWPSHRRCAGLWKSRRAGCSCLTMRATGTTSAICCHG